MSQIKLVALFRILAVAAALALLAGHGQRAAAEDAAAQQPPPFGAWVVSESADQANMGLRMVFSPDGMFLMVDPRTMIGVHGVYSVGRAGLIVNIIGYGRAAEFVNGAYSIDGDTMKVDVRSSNFMQPQQVTLQRIKFPSP